MSSQHAENVDRGGYAVVPGALTEDEAAETREFLTELVEKKNQFDGGEQCPGSGAGGVRHDVFSRYPETRRVLEKPEVLDMLRSTLGEDLVLLPEMAWTSCPAPTASRRTAHRLRRSLSSAGCGKAESDGRTAAPEGSAVGGGA